MWFHLNDERESAKYLYPTDAFTFTENDGHNTSESNGTLQVHIQNQSSCIEGLEA